MSNPNGGFTYQPREEVEEEALRSHCRDEAEKSFRERVRELDKALKELMEEMK